LGFGPGGREDRRIRPARATRTDCNRQPCNNWFGIYGFHTAGANVLMCDGSVRFVGAKLDPLTFRVPHHPRRRAPDRPDRLLSPLPTTRTNAPMRYHRLLLLLVALAAPPAARGRGAARPPRKLAALIDARLGSEWQKGRGEGPRRSSMTRPSCAARQLDLSGRVPTGRGGPRIPRGHRARQAGKTRHTLDRLRRPHPAHGDVSGRRTWVPQGRHRRVSPASRTTSSRGSRRGVQENAPYDRHRARAAHDAGIRGGPGAGRSAPVGFLRREREQARKTSRPTRPARSWA